MQIKKTLIFVLASLLVIPGAWAAPAEETLMAGIIIGLIFLGFVLAFLATRTSKEHSFLRLLFFFMSLLVITVTINMMFISCETYMADPAICELVGAYSNNMTYVFMYVPIAYFLVYLIYVILKGMRETKNSDEYQAKF